MLWNVLNNQFLKAANKGDRLVKLWTRHGEIVILAAVFTGALALYALEWPYTFSNRFHNLVGGVSTIGAERILAGDLPYRDFWTMYAPGHFYLLALLFRLFGSHLLVERAATAIICAGATAVCYRLARNFEGHRLAALAAAAVFWMAVYHTGYFRTLGSYPPAILLVFIALNFMALYYHRQKLKYVLAAGLSTGAVVLFKHDVGGYTAIAIVAGLLVHHFLTAFRDKTRWSSLLVKLTLYAAGGAIVAGPVLAYFAIVAGGEMVQNLVIFPLTDFPFARPEGYPSLLPVGLIDPSLTQTIRNLTTYFNFAIPFGLFLGGLVAVAVAIVKRQPTYAALGVTFAVAYLLHYSAAHVQINTHIITMSVYAVWLGAIFYQVLGAGLVAGRPLVARLFLGVFIAGWLLSLAAQPLFLAWANRQLATTSLTLSKVSGFKASPEEARNLAALTAYIHRRVPPRQPLFVGLHRHDVIIIGDILVYFLLDRPQATRYQELHPAIGDTAPVQREIITDLRARDVSVIVLKQIFPDDFLEEVKRDFLENLPQIGATDLDRFIRENYVKTKEFGPYTVWERRDH